MGVEFHITRAECWSDNDAVPIAAEEWLSYVAADDELQLAPENGPCHVRWLGQSKHDDPWLDWANGNIYTKWPDTALYRKMFHIAMTLDAHIQDDDGTKYLTIDAWKFDPTRWNIANKNQLPPKPSMNVDWGIFTLPVAIAVYIFVNWCTDSFFGTGYFKATVWPKLLAGSAAAISLWSIGSCLNGDVPRRDRQHRFLSLPIEYWAPIVLAFGLLSIFYSNFA